jgi:thiol-disulfide isomerase/thioredoxin
MKYITTTTFLVASVAFLALAPQPSFARNTQPAVPIRSAAPAAAETAEAPPAPASTAEADDLPEDILVLAMRERQAAEAERKAIFDRWRSGDEMAPDFVTYDLDGQEIKVSDYRGKVVILDFWASWCEPCKTAMPHVQQLASQYRDQGVVVLAAGTSDARADFEKFVTKNKEQFPDIIWTHDMAERSDERASRAIYGVQGIPAQFVINRTGKIVDVVVGYRKGEVILDGALAKAGIDVDAQTVEQAEADLAKRGS